MKESVNKFIEKFGFGKPFFAVVVLVYLFLFFSNNTWFSNAFSQTVKILSSIWWILAIVFGSMFLVNWLISDEKISRTLGKKSGLKGWVIAMGAGLLSHGPIFLWYPLLGDLKEKGVRNGFIATFLYNRAVKIPLLPLMIFYFSLSFTIVLSFYMVLFSIINGKVVELLVGK